MNKNNGVTLVVLVITIVVMLILATVTITTMINSSIIDKSLKATIKYELNDIVEKLDNYHKLRQLDPKQYDYDPDFLYADYTCVKYNDIEEEELSNIYDILSELEETSLDKKVYISGGKIVLYNSKISELEKKCAEEMNIEVK